ncbi:MAG: adenosylcobinamide-phosphate synthase CbiB [Oscillospiraceae bacterium]
MTEQLIFKILPPVLGFGLDLLFGDPPQIPHPVAAIGKLISTLEKLLRRLFAKSEKGELAAGAVLAVLVPSISFAVPFVLLCLFRKISPFAGLAAETLMCGQILATKSLRDESMAVYRALAAGNLDEARKAVARIVGRDTDALSADGVARAAVETVAENTGDGIVAPMLFMALGGAPLGFFYKGINTMDSMVGYKSERYMFFGRAAAKLDDLANFIPARLSAVFMLLASAFLRYDSKNALKIFKRDRYNHASPNSAQTESVCAGALDIRLAGDAHYFGGLVRKPTIGDAIRPIEPNDIRRATDLLYVTAAVSLVFCTALRSAAVLFGICLTGGL